MSWLNSSTVYSEEGLGGTQVERLKSRQDPENDGGFIHPIKIIKFIIFCLWT